MKLIIKRYFFPPIITVLIYTLLYLFSSEKTHYLNAGFFVSLLFAYFIRLADDFCDYNEDLKSGKNILNLKTLLIIGVFCITVIVCLCVIFKYWLFFIPLIIVLSTAIFKKYLTFLKPIFLPSIILPLSYYLFNIDLFVYILCLVLFVIDVFLVVKGRKKDAFSK